MTVLVLPMSWSSKIPGVNILENHHCSNPITWLEEDCFYFYFLYPVLFFGCFSCIAT